MDRSGSRTPVILKTLSGMHRAVASQSTSQTILAFVAGGAVLLASSSYVDVYTQSILTVCFIFGIAAVTVDILWGYAGILSYAQGAFFGIGAYSVAMYASHAGVDGISALAPALLIAVLGAATVALVVGGLSFHAKADWLFVAVVTFAAPFIFEKVILAGGETTGSSSGLSGFMSVSLSVQQWYGVTGFALLSVLFVASIFVRSDMGKVLRGIRENETRCRYLGIRVQLIKICLFVVAGVVAAFAGVLYAASQNVVAADLGGFQIATAMVIWTAVGGRGTLFGPAIAAVAINWLTASVGAQFPFVWQLIIGGIFVGVVLFLPGGVASIVSSVWARVIALLRKEPRSSEVTLRSVAGGDYATGNRGRRILELDSVSLNYGSFRAVSDVSFAASAGELVSIVGPNGAGKTSLMRCISDGLQRTSGDIRVRGVELARRPPEQVSSLGVSQKFQYASIFGALTVAESLRVARSRWNPVSLWRSDRTLDLPDSVIQVIEATGLDRVLGRPAADLSHGQKQALELAMVFCTEPQVVLLDEPTAGLSQDERQTLGSLFKRIALKNQLLIILVEHDLDFVREISSRVVVLHQGELLLDGTVTDVVESQVVRDIYTGSLEVTNHGN